MSWLFSRALVEAFSADTCSGGGLFAQLSVTCTPQPFLRNDKATEFSKPSPFGLTCERLTDARGEELLTWFRAGFRARTSAQQEPAPASTAIDPGSGKRWPALLATWDQSSSTWRTAQCSLLAGSDEFSETWPRWGMTRNGASYLRPTPALPICANESGFWPTPTATLASNGGRVTPRKGREGGTLTEAVSARMWPTPCASASKGSSPASLIRKSGASRANDRIDHAVMASDGGQLNPEWVEWLMGWPIGWTGLKPLEMGKFREWQQQHGES